MLKRAVGTLLSSNVKDILRILGVAPTALSVPALSANYIYDFRQFLKWSAVGDRLDTQTKLRAVITMDYHRIEKGLALREPKIGFGRDVIQRLLTNLKRYQTAYGLDETCQIAINTLTAYYQFNQTHGIDDQPLNVAIAALNQAIASDRPRTNQGGIAHVTKQSILNAAAIDFATFTQSRYSIRQFAPDPVELHLIEQAVIMAQKTPSVCNRQSARVYVFSDDEAKRKALSFQNGNRGFGDQASKVLVVVSDLNHFVAIGERYQAWIDGGMFAMSLVYALHSLGLGTCCLNWSVERWADRSLKRATGIKESETVIMMIAVGHLPDELTVAQSPRKPLSEVMLVR
ncbi:nitroreductase family protein [Oculatella sp. LEGE 06141]|uniref:nitroreductase family protein n=1 Tax=Oculatella sp. LEGE 06141 TaxID=1828648 RepID=UPI001D15908E|nr:nitroreductase family protein [Oculatella sp. LEGE 06141]